MVLLVSRPRFDSDVRGVRDRSRLRTCCRPESTASSTAIDPARARSNRTTSTDPVVDRFSPTTDRTDVRSGATRNGCIDPADPQSARPGGVSAGTAPGARVQSLMLRAIVWYQRGAEGRPSPCRFFPSCSEYGHEAISAYGPGRGLWLTVRRLVRCRPFGPSGFDPVPLREEN